MLSDRPYVYQFRGDRDAREALRTVWILIAVNVGAYFLTGGGSRVPAEFCLWSSPKLFRIWQPFTYMFFHAGFSHILFNMYGLYLFGKLIAPILGRTRFLLLYFISGLVGGGLWVAANWGNAYPALGASGALFGVMMGVAMLRPNIQFFMLFVPVPLKASTLVVVYAVLEIISQWQMSDSIAHLAHLGGFLGAYLYLILFCKKDVIWSLKDLWKKVPHAGTYASQRSAEDAPYKRQENGENSSANGPVPHITHVSQQEADRLLDKISQEGINSLSDYERAELQFFREQMLRGRR